MANESRSVILAQKNLKTVSMGLSIPIGAAYETIAGITSVLLNHLQRQTAIHNEDDFAEYIDSKGITTFQQVGRSASYFGVSTPPKHVKEGFELLKEMIFEPQFDEQITQSIIQQKMGQLQQMKSNPEQELTNYTRWDSAFPQDPISRHPSGTMEGLQQINPELLEKLSKELFSNTSYFASVGIGIDQAYFEKLGLDDMLNQFAAIRKKKELTSKHDEHFRSVIQPSPQQSANSYIGINLCLPSSHDLQNQDRIYESVLSGGMSARIFKEIREIRNLSYAPRVSTSRFTGGGLMSAIMDVRPDRVNEALQTTIKVLKDALSEKIPADEMQRALKSAQRVAVFVGDSAELYTVFVLNRLINNLEYDLVKFSHELEKAAKANWQQSILDSWKPENLSFSATGDTTGLEDLWEKEKEELI